MVKLNKNPIDNGRKENKRMNKELKIARIKVGLTQKQLATSVGVTSKYISLIERNDIKPSPKVMQKISDCLNVSVQNLFFEKVE